MKSGFGNHRGLGESIRSKGVVLITALLLLCGTTYAAAALPKNSVSTKQLKNGAVTAQKVKKNSLTGTQINESTLGTVPNAANADTLDGKHASDFLPAGAAISNADTLDGKHAYDFLGVGATAANSERLGNLLPGSFLNTGTNAGGDLAGTYPSPSIANGVITDAKVATANKDGAANVPSLRTLGTGVLQAMPGNATPGGPPSGPAGGALSGSYPNPALDVSGGPCANGEALTDVSASAGLTCGPGVYSDASQNTAVSTDPFTALTTGNDNSAFGSRALEANETGERNSAFGHQTLTSNTIGSENSAVGDSALHANTTGGRNSAVGAAALFDNTTGQKNSAFGVAALFANTEGELNSAVGDEALGANTEGDENAALGANALLSNTIGTKNTAAGEGVMQNNTTGNENSAFGSTALFSNETGSHNSAFGQHTLGSNTTGEENSAFGQLALISNTTGKKNVALGFQAGNALTSGESNIDIGTYVSGPAGETKTIRIGTQGTQEKTFLAGVSGVTTGGVASPVLVDPNGQLGTTSSSRLFKRDIRPLGPQSKRLMALRPVSFRYRRGYVHGPSSLQFGLIAEQVAKVYPNLVVYARDGSPSAIAYQELPALLLAQARRQQVQIDHQRGTIRALRTQNRHQQGQIDWLLRQVRRR
jgi:hypothetical protein